ncbi:MAG: DegT/DnrJ/EryC1/StrS family aminotransferase, partial [Marmoricola sp.]
MEHASIGNFREALAAKGGTGRIVVLPDSVHTAALAAAVGAGDEVVTTPNTFIATAEAIAYTGARPVFVDVRPETGNLDPELLEHAITARTRAIVPVHLYGRPAELDPILAV